MRYAQKATPEGYIYAFLLGIWCTLVLQLLVAAQ